MINNIKNILIIRLAGLGDMILTLSAVAPLKDKFPSAKIYFLTDKPNIEFLKSFDFIDDAIEYKRGLKKTLELIRNLKKLNISAIINFERAFKKTAISYLINSQIRIGYNIFPNKLFNTNSSPDFKNNPNIHMRQRYFELSKILGVDHYYSKLTFVPSKEALQKVEDFLLANDINKSDFIVGINPVTGFKSKYWIDERWAKVADYLIDKKNAKVIFTYGPSEEQLHTCLNIMSKMEKRPVLSFKTNLIEFGALLKKMNLFLCLDSGPFHFAVSLDVPTISLWGRGNVKQWGPEGEHHIAITKNIYCSPCDKFECDNTKCMSSITVQDVIDNIDIIFKSIRESKKYV